MPSTPVVVATQRFDPYLNYRFKVKWDTKYVAGVHKVSPLTRTTKMQEYVSGGNLSVVYKIPRQSDFAAITLERGVTHDADFENWANAIWQVDPTESFSLKPFRKDITIEMYNEAGQLAIAYDIYRCWVSEWQSMGELDGEGNGVLIQTLKLENEGWNRKTTVTPPTHPSFTLPT